MKYSFPSWIKKVLLFLGGIFAAQGFAIFFDYVIYPVVTYKLGFVKSLITLFLTALFFNYILILIYDLFKQDLFGFEALKNAKTHEEIVGNKKFLIRLLRWGDIPFFIALSWYDPLFAALYKRRSTNYDGLTWRDFGYLVLSTSIGCIIWSSIWAGGIKFLLYIKDIIF